MNAALQSGAIISTEDIGDSGVFMDGELLVAGKDLAEVFGGGEGIGGIGGDGGAHSGIIAR